MLDISSYKIEDPSAIDSPGLLYYQDIITRNTENAIKLAGGASRLWPHVKSHKTRELILMQREMGISHFKCATIAEAQMTAECGAEHILIAYPLVGPMIRRFLELTAAYPLTTWYAIGDDEGQLGALSELSEALHLRANVLLDINMGMNRTGVPLNSAEALYRACAKMPGLRMMGLHGYDGHRHEAALDERRQLALSSIDTVRAIRDHLRHDKIHCDLLDMGGTPTFPVHAAYDDVFLSPGTIFLMDWRYDEKMRGLGFEPGAALIARVVSHPAEGLFTIDVGNKAIACEMPGVRGLLLGYEDAVPTVHSEEHWVFRAGEGKGRPAIGEVIYVIPAHICPTNALYASARVVKDGHVVDRWDIAARNRSLGI